MGKRTTTKRAGFVRPTITIPDELEDFVNERKRDPRHAGNLSSYIRSLIINDRQQQLKQAA